MRYDTLIIGGGMAGLSAGLRLAQVGQKTLIMASGQSALHVASGAIDVLNQGSDPWEALPAFIAQHPQHPYAKIGLDKLRASLADTMQHSAAQGFNLISTPQNHQRITAMGHACPTWLSPAQAAHYDPQATPPSTLLVLTFQGFRDIYPELIASNLARIPYFANTRISTGEIILPPIPQAPRHQEYRSMDLANRFEHDQGSLWDELTQQLQSIICACGDPHPTVLLPACFNRLRSGQRLSAIEHALGIRLTEIATMPPSILGIQLHTALRQQYQALGGTYLISERAQGSVQKADRIEALYSQQGNDYGFCADHYILASGSFFNRGLIADSKTIAEPIFNADTYQLPSRDQWAGHTLFSPHPFMQFGVETDQHFRLLRLGQPLANAYGAGSVLAHYDPVAEGSGGGVAIASGWTVAGHILGESHARPQ